LNESELLDRIKKDPSEFSVLFNLYYRQIFGYIFRRTGDFDESADIAADTFLKAFSHIGNFTCRGISVKVWLYRIATNELNQYFRNRKKHSSLTEKIEIENKELFRNSLNEDRKEMETEMMKHEQFLSVLNALKTLPLKYQEVISLKYFEGNTNKEISMILDIKEGTLKSLIFRGLEKLRKICNQI